MLRLINFVYCCRQWEDAEIMVLLQVMYTDLDFISTFNIELDVLQQFLYEVYRRYNNIPFHNFKHCFCVTQMVRVSEGPISANIKVSFKHLNYPLHHLLD